MTMRTFSKFMLLTIISLMGAVSATAQTGPFQFYAIPPCRIVDTRNPNSTNGGPIMGSNVQRDFQVRGVCGVPTTAKAVSLNVTVAGPTQSSFLTLWPSGGTRPVVSTINFNSTDPALANGAIVGVSLTTNDLSVYNNFGSVHVLLDVTGYFQ